MLARSLRWIIALQMLLGLALGRWVFADTTDPLMQLVGVVAQVFALPVEFALVAVVYTMLVSHTANEPAAHWWRALWGECQSGIRVFLLRQPWAFATPVVQLPSGAQPRIPVLLVHGYVCNHRLWDDMAPALQAQEHAVLAIDLEPVFASIDDYAPLVEQAVQTLRQQTGQDRVALVGHSMGGLAIRAWLRQYGSQHAAGVITLGTPHVGTQIRAPFSPLNARQMAWNSTWLQTLAASESDATRGLFRIALSPQDNIVFPQRAQTLPGVVPVVFEGLGHLQLCSDARVRDWLCTELAGITA
jgi:triacylglycerol lipase